MMWILSGTWPLPHRPRVRVAGAWKLTADVTDRSAPIITTVQERWVHGPGCHPLADRVDCGGRLSIVCHGFHCICRYRVELTP
jgi:hypothetical protein